MRAPHERAGTVWTAGRVRAHARQRRVDTRVRWVVAVELGAGGHGEKLHSVIMSIMPIDFARAGRAHFSSLVCWRPRLIMWVMLAAAGHHMYSACGCGYSARVGNSVGRAHVQPPTVSKVFSLFGHEHTWVEGLELGLREMFLRMHMRQHNTSSIAIHMCSCTCMN